jgi:hypothetical protein
LSAATPEAGTGTGLEAAAAGASLGWEDDDFGSAFGDSDDEAAFAGSRSTKGHGERKAEAEADDEGDFGVVLRSGAESVLFEDPRLAAFFAAQTPQQAPPQQHSQRDVAKSAASGLMESILVFDDEDEGY